MKGVKSMDTCPSCHSPINPNGKFCTECGCSILAASKAVSQSPQHRKPKFRSPLLESSILDEAKTEKSHSVLIWVAYCFWIFTAVFLIIGVKFILDNYTKDLLQAVLYGSLYIVLGLFCFIVPETLNILVSIEDSILKFLKQSKIDKLD